MNDEDEPNDLMVPHLMISRDTITATPTERWKAHLQDASPKTKTFSTWPLRFPEPAHPDPANIRSPRIKSLLRRSRPSPLQRTGRWRKQEVGAGLLCWKVRKACRPLTCL
jgi:hypothetical protein